ncbi:PASTA domain-containing protein [Rhodococcus sp. NPDC003318]|uniref:PASTA domain-containing protein n=1 Tax=Rhodococcus sp. NPDC003318 TaxID=3364503 RepID=UPI0036AA02AF
MKRFAPYLRVVAGFFAAICLWLTFVDLVNGLFGDALVLMVFTAGLGYLAVGKPIREYRAQRRSANEALAARAQAGHEAFLAGDPAAFAAPPPEPEKRPVRRGVLIAIGVAAVFVLIGIVSDIGDGLDAESGTGTTTTARPDPADPTTPQAAPTSEVAPATAATVTATQATAAAAAPATMPNVTCMNLQDAQDAIQAAGVFYSRSQDATGQGRNQVLDSNWVVVAQTPSVGSTVTEGEALLSVVRIGEPGDCS